MERSRLKHHFYVCYSVRTDEKYRVVQQSAIQHSAIPLPTNILVPVLIFPGDPEERSVFRSRVSVTARHLGQPTLLRLGREQLHKLLIKDFKHEHREVTHFKISSKGEKTRYIPLLLLRVVSFLIIRKQCLHRHVSDRITRSCAT
jgi:hypothetical protein